MATVTDPSAESTTPNSVPDDQFSLLTEIMHMWGTCVFAPATTNLRGLAKKGLLKSSSTAAKTNDSSFDDAADPNKVVLTLPVSLATITDIFLDNKQLLLDEYSSDPGIPFHIAVLTEYREKYSTYFLEREHIVVFNDASKNSELVYGILSNTTLKRNTLIFRGSVSTMDYKMDFKIGMDRHRCPDGDLVFLHRGFSTYLLDSEHNKGLNDDGITGDVDGAGAASTTTTNGKSPSSVENDKDAAAITTTNTTTTTSPTVTESKFDEIKRELGKCCKQYPDHKIYVSGHSLGGSLALIAAFELAGFLTTPVGGDGESGINETTPRPLTCITFGPLQVGDIRFRRSFQRMECEGLINNINIINRGDLIPLYPVWTGTKWYRFVGNKLKLANAEVKDSKTKNKKKLKEKDMTSTISRAPETSSCFMAWLRDIPNQIKYTGRLFNVLCCEQQFWLNHTVTETTVNLKANAKYLEQLTWDDLYKDCRTSFSVDGARSSTVESPKSKQGTVGRSSVALSGFIQNNKSEDASV